MTARLDDLAQPHVHRLNGIGRVEDPPHLRGEGKEGRHVVPGPSPQAANGRMLGPPRTDLERVQRGVGRRLGRRGVDRSDRGGHRLAVLPARVVQRIADQVYDAGLHGGLREHAADRLGQPLQAIYHRDQNVGHAARAQLVEHLQPELGPFGLFNPQSKNLPRPVRAHTQRQVYRLVPHDRVFTDLHPQRIEEHDRVQILQRPALPRGDLGQHRFAHGADEVERHLHRVHLDR